MKSRHQQRNIRKHKQHEDIENDNATNEHDSNLRLRADSAYMHSEHTTDAVSVSVNDVSDKHTIHKNIHSLVKNSC